MSDMQDVMVSAIQGKLIPKAKTTMDSVSTGDMSVDASAPTVQTIKLEAINAIHQWIESDDLDDGETETNRLFALMVGIADANQDGEITDDEQAVLDVALNSAFEYLLKYGVTEDDASSLLNDWDDDAGMRIRELLAAAAPEGEDAVMDEIDQFVFSDGDQEPTMDSAYKKRITFRNGVKTYVNKRISGTVRLSTKQKMAVRKMQMKAHSAQARVRRMKSMRLRKRAGL